MLQDLWHLAVAFTRVGVLGFGGGPSFIPLVEIEAVDNYGWLTADQFSNTLAIANALPGPIATKMAGYIGYQVAGWLGAVVSLVALVAPTVLALTLLLHVMARYKDLPAVQGMIMAIRPVVAVLLAILVWEFVDKSYRTAGLLQTVLFAAGALLALQVLKIHPSIVVVASLAAGALFLR